MSAPELPIGIQSFEKLRSRGAVYADKTAMIHQLIQKGASYFLSRPRRFGKSLLVDTMDCLFSGKKDLFKGLDIEENWDWSKTNPVLRIDWAVGEIKTPSDLKRVMQDILQNWSHSFSIPLRGSDPEIRFVSFVTDLAEARGRQVVFLVDEYDKPILDNLEVPEVTVEMRDVLKGFYGSIKTLDKHLRFAFLTGVSKFAKTGIFSGLNSLNDITIDSRYSALCGYTQENLETVFGVYLNNFDKQLVREWYNGYSWTGEAVYNPFDILLLFDRGFYGSWWFETGTPSFLIKLFQKEPMDLSDLSDFEASEALLGSFEPDNLRLETLLFQSGYLTIKEFTTDSHEGPRFKVGFPNREVREAFTERLMSVYNPKYPGPGFAKKTLHAIFDNGNTQGLEEYLSALMASIPYDWYRRNPIAEYEGYYSSLIYALFASHGYDVIAEDTTNKDRVDLTVKHRRGVWIFEVKVRGIDRSGDNGPLNQIKERGYAEKYRSLGLPIFLIGVVFDKRSKELVAWESEHWTA